LPNLVGCLRLPRGGGSACVSPAAHSSCTPVRQDTAPNGCGIVGGQAGELASQYRNRVKAVRHHALNQRSNEAR
jgi:hypothetical protein